MRAAIYCRISLAGEGDNLAIDRQEADSRELAARLGWDVVRVYADRSISAYSGKVRPAYQDMVADIKAGKIDAVVAWSVDRLTRHPSELENIIKLHEDYHIELATVGGRINLGTADGRLVARITGAVARGEVEKMSQRIRRKLQQRAESGQLHGSPAYGWARHNGHEVLVPAEAALIREMAERLVAGESLYGIAADLNRRGIPSPGAKEWTNRGVRWLVQRPRNAGILIYRDQEAGPGDFPPIYPVDMHLRVKAILNAPGRSTAYNHGNQRHYLSGIALCGLCGSPLRVLNLPKQGRLPGYVCKEGRHLRIRQAWLDGLIRDLVVARLSQPDALAVFMPRDNGTLLDERASVRARLDLVADQFADGTIDGGQLQRITAKLRPQLAALDARIAESVGPDLSDLVRPDVGEIWDALPLERRRAATARLLTVYVGPSRQKRGQKHFDPSRVSVVWKEA